MLSSGDAVETYRGNGPFEYLSTEWYRVRGIKPPKNLLMRDLSIEARNQVAQIIKRAETADPVQTESKRVEKPTLILMRENGPLRLVVNSWPSPLDPSQ